GERVEEGIKSGKIQGASNAQARAKKLYGNGQKKEGETNAIAVGLSQTPTAQLPYFQYPYVAAIAQEQYPQPANHMLPPQQPSMRP
ncbi:hypothetical protein A2U01_0085919, partial [Trifolium medium]|nr:hypothetical protein [Trifolium medium]